MKHLILLLNVLFAIQAVAQNNYKSSSFGDNTKWTFGTKFGLNIASVDGDYLDEEYVKDSESFVGFHGGGWVNYKLYPKISVQAELLGSLHGGNLDYELEYNGIKAKSEVEMRLPYVLIPVMFKYEPLPNGYLELGSQMNILIKEDFAYKVFLNNAQVNDEQAEQLIANRLKDSRRLDIGVNIGAGYKFFTRWMVYTRYTFGLLNIDSREENQQDLKNRVFAFGVGYEF